MGKKYSSGMILTIEGRRFAIRHWVAYGRRRVYVQSEVVCNGYHSGWKDAGYIDMISGESHVTRGRCSNVQELVGEVMAIDYGEFCIDIPDEPPMRVERARVPAQLF